MQSGMVVYYAGTILAAIFAGIAQKLGKNTNKKVKLNYLFWILSMAVFVFLYGFRQIGIGVDDPTYERIFNNVAANGVIKQFLETRMEPGYLLLNYIVSFFTNNFQVMIFITTLIPVFLYYKALEYESDKISMFWAVFLLGTILFIYFCGITRLFIATSIIAYGLRFVMEKKPIKYTIIVFIATSFHYSAIFMIFLLYFATERKGKKKSNIKIFLLIAIVMPVMIFIVSNYIFPNMGDRYSGYTEIKNGTLSIDSFDKLPFILIAIFFSKQMLKDNKNIDKYITIYAMALIISVYSVFLDIGRMQWYCMFSTCIILPSILEVLKKIKSQEYAIMYIPLMAIYAILYAYVNLTSSTRQDMLFYKNIFFM